ncbi:hypothetical protein AVEN_82895-1 [Araneus ventricosus]|uniref:Uncharacterized protein n=1 Tax=Araneus ventricosus TaxID=182803 RepID=A0A4Y2JXC3_ARAVE|nr:hypothetical protein AVEN_82895-1 [Araneus ventricosus]
MDSSYDNLFLLRKPPTRQLGDQNSRAGQIVQSVYKRIPQCWWPISSRQNNFEVTRGIFWDDPPNFEQRSDDEDDTGALRLPLETSAPHQRNEVWPMLNLTCTRPTNSVYLQ